MALVFERTPVLRDTTRLSRRTPPASGILRNSATCTVFSKSREQYPRYCGGVAPQHATCALNPESAMSPTWRFLFSRWMPRRREAGGTENQPDLGVLSF